MAKPKIRFNGYTEDWEQRELSEIALQTYGGGTPKTANEEFWKGNIPWIQSSDLIEERLFNVKPRKYISQEAISKSSTKLVPQNSIAIVTRVGVGKLAFMPFSYATSQDFLSLSELKIEPKFAVYALYKMMRLVSNEVQGTSIKGITKDELLAKEILIPDCEEQKKIGAYLHNLDHLITLHQRKCEQTKTLKKYMLQKMFPQDGEKVPQIRFEGFTEDWEQRKVGELLEERNEQAPMSEDYPLMAFIANQGVAPKGERYDRSALVNDETGKKYKRTEFGDFIYSSNNLETGSIGLNKYGNACISPVYSIFKPTGKAELDFLGRRFLRKDFINEMVRWRQGVVYGQWKIHETDFMKIEVRIPSVDEQKKIGQYFDSLDNLITLHQRKCDELKEVKKFMLQNMFV